jgi:hypothetical protein
MIITSIKKEINYKLILTENQLRELHNLLLRAKNDGHLTHDNDLFLILNELKYIFTGIR